MIISAFLAGSIGGNRIVGQQKRLTAYGGFGLCHTAKTCEGCEGRGGHYPQHVVVCCVDLDFRILAKVVTSNKV